MTLSNMNKTSISNTIKIILILFGISWIESVPLSPCPRIFHYEYDGQNWIGIIQIYANIYNKYRAQTMTLLIKLSMPFVMSSSFGSLKLYHSVLATNNHIVHGRPIKYIITFPERLISPSLLQIQINSQSICGNEEIVSKTIYQYQLVHTIFLPSPSFSRASRQLAVDSGIQFPLQIEYSDNFQDFTALNIIKYQRQQNACGRMKNELNHIQMIKNGENVPQGFWPWLVAIYLKKTIEVHFHCSGTLISNRLVLTAANCLWLTSPREPTEILLALGRYNLRNWSEPNALLSDVSSIHFHPDFMKNNEPFDADIAIIRPKISFEYNSWIQPICLWTHVNPAPVSGIGTFIGWDINVDSNYKIEPKLINMPMVTRYDCIKSKLEFKFITSNRTFCAGTRNGHGPCNENSGGALAVWRNGRWFLRGIVSRAFANPIQNSWDLNDFVVFTDVPKYTKWLDSFL